MAALNEQFHLLLATNGTISSFNASDAILMFLKCFEVHHDMTHCVNSWAETLDEWALNL